MKMTGAQILIESLKKEGVEIIFGYPGGQVLPIFDKLYGSPLKLILTRHEQAAAHAADGYARATGKVGVCLATSGPGATNLVTGIATAYMDSIPMVAITGQVKSFLIGNDAFQEADITGITRPITKHNYLVEDVKDLARTVKEAFHIASTGRPGPVLIDLPADIQMQEAEFVYPQKVNIRGYNPTYEGHPGQIKRAAKAISDSKRPVLYVGGGVIISDASKEVREFALANDIPVTMTLLGLGAFPQEHKLSLGMPGMHGTAYANHSIMESDLIIAVGARFDDRVTGKVDEFAPHAKVIHIDIDPASVSKSVEVDIPIVGDAKAILKHLIKSVKKPDTKDWLKQIEAWKVKYPLKYKDDGKIKPQYVLEEIWRATKGDAIICTEVGQHQMWTAQFYKFEKPRTMISSGGLGTMGYGFPAAIGAQFGKPKATVFDIAGDGSIQMNVQELATAVINKLPVKVAILNNGCLGMVRQWQELFYGKRYSYTTLDCMCPDFVKLAESYGAVGIRVTKKSEVRGAIERALKIDNCVFIDFHIEEEENVYPMVPAGQAINKMLGG
ncbi:MAG: biosynthetic-type acetolactate synthase large subunit, partial [Candidatus Omnitrophica bacterium]|nr:biosynthetic-type acetolactate synthase large subunit [Candidatus Omnitrophota bacterium]